MELTGKLAEAFSTQVTLELTAATVYRQLAVEMEVLSLPGIAGWFRAQAGEEIVHAEKFMTHMTDRSAHPKIGEQPAPTLNVKSVADAFAASLAHEQKVSKRFASCTDWHRPKATSIRFHCCTGSSTSRLKKRPPLVKSWTASG